MQKCVYNYYTASQRRASTRDARALAALNGLRRQHPAARRGDRDAEPDPPDGPARTLPARGHQADQARSEEHTSELQSPCNLVCRLLLEQKKNKNAYPPPPRRARLIGFKTPAASAADLPAPHFCTPHTPYTRQL